ncbi:hypothetical protein [Levilactobacillus spicheri]|uniref:Mechanosensitive ion channel protein MscL n=1 Tax=Levilactobacillus spicheri TaxID=216463 RepID=A0ABQ0WWN0_9LACO|nr:hypothetical protein [Levilactobacillus spicheri]GEO68085.1 hypothetical protein LSP04_25040 [Levilactobacillus spicheri]
MSEAVSRLIDTLNGQFKELPALAKTMVEQWTMSHYIIAGIGFLVFVAIVAVAVNLFKGALKKVAAASEEYAKKREEDVFYTDHGMDDQLSSHWQTYVSAILGAISSLPLIFSLASLYKALNPIVTLINNFR